MGSFFGNLLQKYQQFMYGRYGSDMMNFTLYIVALVLNILMRLFRFISPTLYIITYLISGIIIVYTLFRSLSKNIDKRRHENEIFLKYATPWKLFFKKKVNQAKDKDHKYFTCPKCSKTLRVPKGKGKIKIDCPFCGKNFTKRT